MTRNPEWIQNPECNFDGSEKIVKPKKTHWEPHKAPWELHKIATDQIEDLKRNVDGTAGVYEIALALEAVLKYAKRVEQVCENVPSGLR